MTGKRKKSSVKKGPVVDMSNQHRRTAMMAGSQTQQPAQPAKPVYPPGTKVESGKIDLSGKPPAKPVYPPGTKVEHGKMDLSGEKKPPQVAAKSLKFARSPGLLHQREATTGHGTYVMTPHDRSGKMQVHYHPNGGDPRKIGSFSGKHTASTAAREHHDHVAKGDTALPDVKKVPGTNFKRREALRALQVAAGHKRYLRNVEESKTTKPKTSGGLPLHTDPHAYHGEWSTLKVKQARKAFQVMSLDDYYDGVVKAGMQNGPSGSPAPLKKFPRPAATDDFADEGPTKVLPVSKITTHKRTGAAVRMRAISDQDAVANLKAGKHKKPGYEKSLRKQLTALKALATGYGKFSGGGALNAPNRLMLNLERAMDIEANSMPPRSAKKPPPVPAYLPGVHDPAHPARKKKQPLLPGQTLKKDVSIDDIKPDKGRSTHTMTTPTTQTPKQQASAVPGAVETRSPKQQASAKPTPAQKPALDAQVREVRAWKSENVVQKSAGDHSMAKTNFNDLFKSDLPAQNEDVLCECPHCDAPITKSDLEKAHVKGASPGSSKGDGHGQVKSSRPGSGIPKQDAPAGVQNSKGSKARKAFDDSSSCDASSGDDDSSDDSSDDKKDDKAPPFTRKDAKKSITVRGTEWVQYVDDGSDAAIAKSIAEQSTSPHQPTQPLDRNNDLTRLLI